MGVERDVGTRAGHADREFGREPGRPEEARRHECLRQARAPAETPRRPLHGAAHRAGMDACRCGPGARPAYQSLYAGETHDREERADGRQPE